MIDSDLEALREIEAILVEALALFQEGLVSTALRDLIDAFDGDLLFEVVASLCPDFMKNGDELLARRSTDGAVLRLHLVSRQWRLEDRRGSSVVGALEEFTGEAGEELCRKILVRVGQAYALARYDLQAEGQD